MTKVSSPSTSYRSSGGERVFADEQGRLWSAAHAGEVIIFTCISDGRNSGRAIIVNLAKLDSSVEDETLRAWLERSPANRNSAVMSFRAGVHRYEGVQRV